MQVRKGRRANIKTMSMSELLWAVWQFSQTSRGQDSRVADEPFSPAFMLWLGAGASVESGIPLANQLAMIVLRDRYDNTTPKPSKSSGAMSDEEINKWAESQGYFTVHNKKKSKYAQIMENMLHTAGLREHFLRRELRKAKVSDGYKVLGEFLKRGVFDTLLTTNFDHLVRQGSNVLPWPIEEVNSADQYRALDPFPHEPRIIRMHGDFWHGNLRNTGDELNRTPEIIYQAVRKLCHSYGLIVLGYGGEDVSVGHGLFHKLWEDPHILKNGLYWCDVKEKDELSPLVKSFLKEGAKTNRAFYVKIDGFDKFMRQLGAQFGIDIYLEKEMEKNIKGDWEWLALLTDLADAIVAPDNSWQRRQKSLERLAKRLGAERALCASLSNVPAGWELNITPHEPLPQLDKESIAASLTELHAEGKDYKKTLLDELPIDNVFYEFLKGSGHLESFPVWRDEQLVGLAAFASSQQSLVDQDRLRLIRAAVKLLITLQSAAYPAARSGRPGGRA